MRAAIYARVSTDEQTRGHSLDTQIADAQAFAQREGLDVVQIYREDGVSGAERDRPELNRLIDDVASFGVVLVRHIDRLARDAEFALYLSNLLHSKGVEIYALQEGMRDTAGEDRLTYGVRALVAEEERKRTTERMIRGKQEAAREGKWHGGERPFGTVLVPHRSGRGHTLDIDTGEAAAIRRVYELIVLEGQSAYQAAQWLNDQGIRTRRGKQWTHQNLKFLLKNRRLTGAGQSWGETIPHPEILTPSEFVRLRGALESYRRAPAKGKAPYPLSGRIICGCGVHWIGGKRKEKRWYRCAAHPSYVNRNTHEPCTWSERRWADSDKLEAAVRDLLWDEYFAAPGAIEDAVIRHLAQREPFDAQALGTARAEVTRLEDKLADVYMREDLDAAAQKKAVARLGDDLGAARTKRDELEQAAEAESVELSWYDDLVNLRATLNTESWADLYRIYQEFGPKLDKAAESAPVRKLTEDLKEWLAQGDLGPVVEALDIKIELTGRDTFEVAGWLPLGKVMDRGFTPFDRPPATGSRRS